MVVDLDLGVGFKIIWEQHNRNRHLVKIIDLMTEKTLTKQTVENGQFMKNSISYYFGNSLIFWRIFQVNIQYFLKLIANKTPTVFKANNIWLSMTFNHFSATLAHVKPVMLQ